MEWNENEREEKEKMIFKKIIKFRKLKLNFYSLLDSLNGVISVIVYFKGNA